MIFFSSPKIESYLKMLFVILLIVILSSDNWKIVTNQLKTVSLEYLSELETKKYHFKGNDVYVS